MDKKDDIKDLKIKYLLQIINNIELTALMYDYNIIVKEIGKYKTSYRNKFKEEK